MKKVDLKIQNENSVTYLLKVVFGNTGTSGISFTPIGLQMKLPLSLFLTRLDAAQCAVKLGKMCNFWDNLLWAHGYAAEHTVGQKI